MKAQTMLIIPFSLIGIVYRTGPVNIVSCAGVSSKNHFDDLLSLKGLEPCRVLTSYSLSLHLCS